ncbi:hypothetical protein [Bacillus inaquosorum]|uniref:hypothetical protein n=2 Tax=Bacillus inaquosorum TaxID=483913 RepID=UPI00227E43EE|nr:hypothetical protein [Bacillus inaquosorum]MCY7980434.1 hypothetical protein [Bacillus inaquosorum]MCY8282071.1 hypothetical protein [Bacillus inaquosorum]MCY9343497.1 hypothetical protein [Bacillus inaquosorum]
MYRVRNWTLTITGIVTIIKHINDIWTKESEKHSKKKKKRSRHCKSELQYTVKEEIEHMEENILVKGLALRMNAIMKTIYLFVIKFYVEGIIESIKWFDSLQGELGGSTILSVSDSVEEYESGKFNFQPMDTHEFIKAVHDLNENPGINIDFIK